MSLFFKNCSRLVKNKVVLNLERTRGNKFLNFQLGTLFKVYKKERYLKKWTIGVKNSKGSENEYLKELQTAGTRMTYGISTKVEIMVALAGTAM